MSYSDLRNYGMVAKTTKKLTIEKANLSSYMWGHAHLFNNSYGGYEWFTSSEFADYERHSELCINAAGHI